MISWFLVVWFTTTGGTVISVENYLMDSEQQCHQTMEKLEYPNLNFIAFCKKGTVVLKPNKFIRSEKEVRDS